MTTAIATLAGILIGSSVVYARRCAHWCEQAADRCEAAEQRLVAVLHIISDAIREKP